MAMRVPATHLSSNTIEGKQDEVVITENDKKNKAKNFPTMIKIKFFHLLPLLLCNSLASPLYASNKQCSVKKEYFTNPEGFCDTGKTFKKTCSSKKNSSPVVIGRKSKRNEEFHELIEWINKNGGYINPKQEIRRENPHDAKSLRGIFATERIRRGELIASIPWHLIVKPTAEDYYNDEEFFYDVFTEGEDDDKYGDEEQEHDYFLAMCGTARAVLREMKLEMNSEKGDVKDSNHTTTSFGPYIRGLLAEPSGQIPDAWSEPGRSLLALVTDSNGTYSNSNNYNVHNRFWVDEWWRKKCRGDPSDEFAEHVAMLVVQREEDFLMIPYYEYINHRNGEDGMNTYLRRVEDVSFEILAWRDIENEGQIYASYNQCNKCENRMYTYGTQDLLHDYGFVEDLPQRWIFHDIGVSFDIAETEDEGEDLEVTWIPQQEDVDEDEFDESDEIFLPPEKILYFQKVLQRLEHMAGKKKNLYNSHYAIMPTMEWETVWRYHNAMIVAISHAIDAANEAYYDPYIIPEDDEAEEEHMVSAEEEEAPDAKSVSSF